MCVLQLLELTNDLNDREDFIIALKKREAALMEDMESKGREYESENSVRLQLARRLNQVV